MSNELIKVTYDNDRPTVLGRELHEALGIKTAYKDWFPRMCEYGFTEGTDFCSILSESTGGRPSTNHQLTIEMAKEICMIQRSEIGKKFRQYFIDLEKAWNTPEAVMARALQHANNQLAAITQQNKALTETVFAQNQQIDAQAQQIEELEPKGRYYDLVLQTKSTMTTTQIAKDYGFSAQLFNRILNEIGIIYPQNKSWVLYQKYANEGYSKSNTYTNWHGDVGECFVSLTWTQRGRLFIYEELKKNGILPCIETGFSQDNERNSIVIRCRTNSHEKSNNYKAIQHDTLAKAYVKYKNKEMTVKEICKRLGISVPTFHNKIRKYEKFPELLVY